MKGFLVLFLVGALVLDVQAAKSPPKWGSWKGVYCSMCQWFVDRVEEEIVHTPNKFKVTTRFRIDEKQKTLFERTEANIIKCMDIIDEDKVMKLKIEKRAHEKYPGHYRLAQKENGMADTGRAQKKMISGAFIALTDEKFDVIVKTLRKEHDDVTVELCVHELKACDSEQMMIDLTLIEPPEPKQYTDEFSPEADERMKSMWQGRTGEVVEEPASSGLSSGEGPAEVAEEPASREGSAEPAAGEGEGTAADDAEPKQEL